MSASTASHNTSGNASNSGGRDPNRGGRRGGVRKAPKVVFCRFCQYHHEQWGCLASRISRDANTTRRPAGLPKPSQLRRLARRAEERRQQQQQQQQQEEPQEEEEQTEDAETREDSHPENENTMMRSFADPELDFDVAEEPDHPLSGPEPSSDTSLKK